VSGSSTLPCLYMSCSVEMVVSSCLIVLLRPGLLHRSQRLHSEQIVAASQFTSSSVVNSLTNSGSASASRLTYAYLPRDHHRYASNGIGSYDSLLRCVCGRHTNVVTANARQRSFAYRIELYALTRRASRFEQFSIWIYRQICFNSILV
jgi:hypothetical protein